MLIGVAPLKSVICPIVELHQFTVAEDLIEIFSLFEPESQSWCESIWSKMKENVWTNTREIKLVLYFAAVRL